jgi:hypothetical protein
MKSVYSAVRTGSLNKAVCASSLKGYLADVWKERVTRVTSTMKMVAARSSEASINVYQTIQCQVVRLVADLLQCNTRFDSGTVHMKFVE